MTSQESSYQLSEKELSKIFGTQRVKLYKIKYIIFDFGGVMVEKTFVLDNLFQIINHDLGIIIPLEDPHYKKYRRALSSGRISSREFLEKIFDRYYYPTRNNDNKTLKKTKVNIEYYLELWFQIYSQFTNFSSEMEEIIERLHRADYVVCLMSNTFDIHAKSNDLKGFYDIFDHVFLSNEIGFRKPELEKYKHVLKKLDTKPKRCIFIDDKIRNLVPARELGMIVIRFESIEKFKEQLNDMGIEDITRNLRHKIKKKYKKYKIKKKAYKKAKKAYKKAKKEYLKKKKRSLSKRDEFRRKRKEYEKKKLEYIKEREKKKEELIKKVKFT
ncbi:MAG: HAD family phosphatase [Promethearchaeota archaeon]|nr:MAG: HAD family phosphatase [Candidatus Lokiarchaeota archaeon]